MNTNNHNNSQEIDLAKLYNNITSSIALKIYNLMQFFLKNIIYIIILFVIGAGIGFYLDKQKNKLHEHQVILALNFDSSAFLYNKIQNLDPEEFPEIASAKIEPIIDVVTFIQAKWDNIKIAEYLSENNISIHKYKKGEQTEKIYRYHLLTLKSEEEDVNGSIINGFLEKLNQESYFLNRKIIENQNIAMQIAEYEKSIEDLNKIFKNLGSEMASTGNGIKIETQSQANDLLNNKQNIIERLSELKIIQSEQSKVFYDLTRITNIQSNSVLFTVLVPVVLLFLLFFFNGLRFIYIKYRPN
jgi:hypothetical protein